MVEPIQEKRGACLRKKEYNQAFQELMYYAEEGDQWGF